MAKAILILEDEGPDGEVEISFRFEPKGVDDQSSAHALASRQVDVLRILRPHGSAHALASRLLSIAVAVSDPAEEEGA